MKQLIIFSLIFLCPHWAFSQWAPKTSHTSEDLYEVHFLDSDFGVAVGDNGTIVKTEDKGNSWTLVPTNLTGDLKSIKVISKDTLLVTSGKVVSSEAFISYNGGTTFTKVSTGYKIGCADENTYVMVSREGVTITEDRAKTWNSAELGVGPTTELDRFAFITDSIGYLMGNVGVETLSIVFGTRTDDGGKTWGFFDTNFLPNFSGFSAIAPINKDSVYVFLFENVNFIHTGIYEMFLFHKFKKDNSTGSYSFEYEWINPDTEIAFSDAHFINKSLGYGTAWNGSIYKTDNGGEEWNKVFNFDVPLRDLHFVSENLAFAVGDEGNINRYYIPTSSVKSVKFEDISISPNPTSDFINIRTSSTPKQIKATLITADGKKLYEEDFIQKTSINIQQFNPGIYFLNLRSRDNYMTERILIK
jgi:photosystem II stability/assembly factor-like uncharacterized protein